MRYRVEGFVHGGSLFRNLARLSAAGIPDHRAARLGHGRRRLHAGPEDVVIMVAGARAPSWPARRCSRPPPARSRPRRSWAAPRCTPGLGLGEYLAEDDRHALALARAVLAQLDWAAPEAGQIRRAATRPTSCWA
jgi:geranyl-CoA carboxylase beta subunit